MMVKILLWAVVALVLGLLIVTALFAAVSSGRVEPYRDADGKVLPGSISEKIIVRLNGADNGLIIRGKNLDNPVLLLVSSGPGTSDYFLNQAYPAMNLEEYFTVCWWDYRGMCMVYDRNLDPASITNEVIQQDTAAVTDYLKERFHKDTIYLMGFSGGTHIALEAAARHPESYAAYIGMAQAVTSGADNDTVMYDFMKQVFTERGDRKSLKKLEKSVEPADGASGSGRVVCRDWASYVYLVHTAGGGTIKDKDEFHGIIIPILKARCYTVKEKLNYIRGMKMYRTTPFYDEVTRRDYRTLIPQLAVPAYFISGESDYNSPWPLVEDYCAMLAAPAKGFLKVPGAAHSPLWENPEPVVEFLRSISR